MNLRIQPLQRDDERILWELQYYASLMDEEGKPKESIHLYPDLSRYVRNWGSPGDFGFAACDQIADKVIGAAWCRMPGGELKGFGYVAENIPELSIAVLPEYRGKGTGTALLQKLLGYARQTAQAVSLAVRSTNNAVALYEKLGFTRIPKKDFLNRSGVVSYVMIYSPENG